MFEGTRDYELLYLIRGGSSPDEVSTIKNQVKGIVAEKSERILREEDLGKRRLAYQMAGETFGIYGLIHFRATPAAADALGQLLRLERSILRHTIVKLDPRAARAPKEASIASAENKPRAATPPATTEPRSETTLPNLDELDRKLDEILKGNPNV